MACKFSAFLGDIKLFICSSSCLHPLVMCVEEGGRGVFPFIVHVHFSLQNWMVSTLYWLVFTCYGYVSFQAKLARDVN